MPQRLRRPVARGVYEPEIDGLRFLAIAIVVLGHFMERALRFFPAAQAQADGHPLIALLLRPGYGVYLFFTISGFVIAGQVLRARAEPLSPAFLQSYFGRRVLRIEPPYLILLVATFGLVSVTGYVPAQTNHFAAVPASLGLSLAGSVVYLHDLVWGVYPRLFPPGWSLETEVQFYVVAPLLFWALLRTPAGPARVALGVLGLAAGSFASLTVPAQIGPIHTATGLPRVFHFFWLGLLLAFAKDRVVALGAALPDWLAGLVGWAGLAAFVGMPYAPDDDLALAMAIRAATLLTVAAIFLGALAPRSSFRSFCARPWISLVGGACYSIYLTHLQTIQATTGALAKLAPHGGLGLVAVLLVVEVAIVLVVGLAFYAVVERTFMIKDWPRRLWGWTGSAFARTKVASQVRRRRSLPPLPDRQHGP